ncbi:MAG: type IV secretory system conjugative DNA transfer family protein, partial [Alphaproteobacteria bacterium]|nr:type IV secretory system conjugative DNA transfer family protein [Alphaproteobacteria bacterium]
NLEGDAPLLTIAGAGAGKTRDQLAYVLCNSSGQRMIILDPRGELAAISQFAHALNGDHAWHWNPYGLCDLPRNACDPLDILTLDSLSFHTDCKYVAKALVAETSKGDGKYFDQRARGWVRALLKHLVEQNGRVSLPDLFHLVGVIETDPDRWADHLEQMLASRFPTVRRTAGEMVTKQQDSPREFGSIMGTVYAALDFLDDPTLLSALEKPDFSLSTLLDPVQPAKLFLNIQAEHLSLWAPLIRLFFTVAMLYKSRAPEAERILLLVDEAGQLGSFEALLRAFTFGRGAGVRAWAVFQDTGQIERNFGAPALQGFMGSAQMRQFFGVRDYQTARMVSEMLGRQTLEYDDERAQAEARLRKRKAVMDMFSADADPFETARDYAHHAEAECRRTKQARELMTPAEVLAMPEDRQILFISGLGLNPVMAWKYPYFTRREMAGRYLGNPYHPPVDRVRVKRLFGNSWVRVLSGPVPDKLRSFPQFRSGTWRYLEGYHP